MSGLSRRFAAAGYTIPKFMIDVDGKKVIEHIVELYPQDSEFIFIINDEHSKDKELVDFLEGIDIDRLTLCSVPVHKKGPVYSIEQFEHHIEDDEQVIVNYCDFSMNFNYENFEEFVNETQCDGCVVCYTGFHPHMLGSDNYAFCKVDDHNKISEIREKEPFTDNKMTEFASTGTYYFKKGSYVKKYFKELIEKDINIKDEYYVSLVHNLLIEDGLTNLVYEVPHMLQWGTPLDLDMYRKWSSYYSKVMEGQKEVTLPNCVTAFPMAGFGSRFRLEGYWVPKPCIEVNGHYMMDRALKCLPKTEKVILGARTEHKDLLPLHDYGDVVWFDEVLPGQACTTEKIVREIEPEKSFLVSACDNGVLYDADKFLELVNDKDNDIIVWSYRNNYTSHYNPNAYSWLDVNEEDIITNVSVKDFTGDNPLDKHAIIGTMFFRNKDIYTGPLSQLYQKNHRTNGEFYIDNLLNEAIDLGYIVRNFEVDKYICWGTPTDLQTYKYWQNFFDTADWHPYEYAKDYLTN
jgi:NDP-sugar pyrophosphorylase family protein